MSEEIRKKEDRIVRLLVFGVGKVCADLILISDMGAFSLISCSMNLLSSMFLISPLASPSCLTPMVQHLPGGLDAIVLPYTSITVVLNGFCLNVEAKDFFTQLERKSWRYRKSFCTVILD